MAGTTLAIAGDVMLGRLVDEALARRGLEEPWAGVRGLVGRADAFLFNLECAVCGDLPRWREDVKPFHFRLRPEHAGTLVRSGVDAILVANNHVMDHGVAGLAGTLGILDELGIPRAGAGRDLAEARAAARFVAEGGARVALVGAADHPREWAAGPRTPGIFLVDPGSAASVAEVSEAVGRAREDSDVVVLGLHWGPNMRRVPPPAFRRFARAAIDAGADVVWGTSAHLFQAIEFHGGGVILYDTGDFLDDYAVDPVERNDLSFLFLVDLDDEGRCAGVRLRPVAIEDRRTRPAREGEAEFLVERMESLCRDFGTRIARKHEGVRAIPRGLAGARGPPFQARASRGG